MSSEPHRDLVIGATGQARGMRRGNISVPASPSSRYLMQSERKRTRRPGEAHPVHAGKYTKYIKIRGRVQRLTHQ